MLFNNLLILNIKLKNLLLIYLIQSENTQKQESHKKEGIS